MDRKLLLLLSNETSENVLLSYRTVESESYRDYESVFIIPGTSVDTNRKRQLNADPLDSATKL